ncbi:spore germination protein [Cohnella sp. JJ-181]|uniref:spore germination protein n=1 Tax=Cohnella rhizoplanae TaxID=2974897 RepID=UPI0022FF9C57|nr:spore germination protein [Cohnella sp. JJ-181]CAI6043923.1 Spore germination protein A1 [Cohnella sp. JJ-181]
MNVTEKPAAPSIVERLRYQLGGSSDFIVRFIHEDPKDPFMYAVCYIDGLVDKNLLAFLLEAVAAEARDESGLPPDLPMSLASRVPVGALTDADSDDALVQAMLNGEAVIVGTGLTGGLCVAIPGGPSRSVEEPSSQTVVRGPKDGFTENLADNLSLVRRRLRTPHLRIEDRVVGRYTRTKVAVVYIEGIVQPVILDELRRRLDAIDIDGILESGYIEELIQDTAWTPFPTIHNTERPDTVAGHLLEGHAAVLVDGTPFALIVPVTFFKFFLSSEDYYQRHDIASFVRIIRFIAFFVSLLLPSLYIAVTTFQQEMIPTTMLISLAAQREGIPLPALLEALLMELTFEVIREAGIRMPRVIGPAISIVGALVLGQAAVQAGLVSGAMVIIVSFTAIASFVIPALGMSAAIRLMRFLLMALAGSFGLFGILAGMIPLLLHLVSLRSFGIPYLLPVAPLKWRNFRDLFVRLPWRALKERPAVIGSRNPRRQPRTGPKKEENRT